MKADVNRIQIAEVGYYLENSCKLIGELISQLQESVSAVNIASDAEELRMFEDIFNNSAVTHLNDLKKALEVWATKFTSISQVYYTAQKECYREIMSL